MKKDNVKLYQFLKASFGNWRNAIFIDCNNCPFDKEIPCNGFLFAIGSDAIPILITVDMFYAQSGEHVDKQECIAIVDRCLFEQFYSLWLAWNIDSPTSCILSQLSS